MLTGANVVMIGGDARQLEIVQKLSEMDAAVTLIGYDSLQNAYSGVTKTDLKPEVLQAADAIILPVVGMDDQGRIDSIFAADGIVLKQEQLHNVKKHLKIYTGMAKPFLKKLCREQRIDLVELLDRDDIAIYNSIPTAEGAVMMAIQHTDITLHGSNCMVLGFGRTGMTMARTLKGLGANVKVGVRRSEHYARAWECGFDPFYMQDLSRAVDDLDLLFNTIPAPVVTAHIIANMPHRCVIIDLASKPGGTDFRYAEKRGIKAMLAPGLPGVVAPKTAGQILANCLVDLLQEDIRNWGNG